MLLIGLLSIFFFMIFGMAQFDRKRYRTCPTTPLSGAGIRSNASIAGPFNELHIRLTCLTDAHTLDGAGMGIVRAMQRLYITSNKAGLIADMDGITLYALSSCLFNTAAATDTVGGAAADGFRAILPIGVDMDESINIAITNGALLDVCSTNDLLGFVGTYTINVELLDQNPETYWAYRNQAFAAGVYGAAGVAQQPTPLTVPSYVLTKELYVTQPTALTTACALLLANIRLFQADDSIVDMPAADLADLFASQKGFAPRNGYLLVEHRPIQNNDTTTLTLTNGAVAIFATSASEMMYIYQAGKISDSGRYVPRSTANNAAAAQGAPPSPTRNQVKIVKKKGFAARFF